MQGLYRWDMDTFRAVNLGHRSPLLDALFLVLSVTGLGGLEALVAVCLYPWPALRRFILPLIVSVAISGLLLADGIKKILPRDRPSNLGVAITQEDFHHGSFVSGHTTTAFAFATTLLLMTLGTRRGWVGPLALLWAFGVGVSRVYRGVHWPSDVLGGAFAGMFGASLVYLVFARRGWLDLDLQRRPASASAER